jgi:hypothetical protein
VQISDRSPWQSLRYFLLRFKGIWPVLAAQLHPWLLAQSCAADHSSSPQLPVSLGGDPKAKTLIDAGDCDEGRNLLETYESQTTGWVKDVWVKEHEYRESAFGLFFAVRGLFGS